MGAYAGGNVTTANNVICIGAAGANVDNSCYIASVWNQPEWIVNRSMSIQMEKLETSGIFSCSYKDEIEPIQQASEVIYRAQPGQLPLQAGD